MKKIVLLFFLILTCKEVKAQPATPVFRAVTTLPTTCSVGQAIYLTTGSQGQYNCTEVNTWTILDGGSGSSPCGSTVGEVQLYASPTTFGCTLNFLFTVSTDALTLGNITPIAAVGTAAAPTVALAGLGAGNVNNGKHDYYVTFVSPRGESSAANINTVTVFDNTMNGQVAVSAIATGPTGTTARKLYRTPAYLGPYTIACEQLLATLSDNTTTTFADNVADASLGACAFQDIDTTSATIYSPDGQLSFNITNDGYWGVPATNVIGLLTLQTPGFGLYGQLGFGAAGPTHGGLGVSGFSDPNAAGMIFGATIDGTASLPPTIPAFAFNAQRDHSDPLHDGEVIVSFGVDFSCGTQPCPFEIVSGGNNDSAGFPSDGGRGAINSPLGLVLATWDIYNVHATDIGQIINEAASQSANDWEIKNSSGAVVAKVIPGGTFQPSAYNAADGTAGTTGNGFKNGLCTTAGGACIPTGVAMTANPLSQFASTTSAQLRGVISDESGNGVMIFGGSTLFEAPVLRGTSSALSGALTIGTCNTTTVAITGATTSMDVVVTPVTNPDTGSAGLTRWDGYVSSANTVTVRECGLGIVTPNSTAYNVAVIQ
jgi:hypothetical protein